MTPLPICPFCNDFVDEPNPYRETTGWLKRGPAGGGQVVLRYESGRVAHRQCILDRRLGAVRGQEGML